jgi:uncharacterized protein (DUF2147 family)
MTGLTTRLIINYTRTFNTDAYMMRPLLISVLAIFLNAAAQAAPLDVEGEWIAPNRDGRINGHVKISDCGDGTPCGVLVWLDPNAKGRTLDERNPDKTLRHRPLLGVHVLSGFERHGRTWRRGRLYNPEDGMSFACSVTLDPDGQLLVTGCLGPLCQTKAWKRVDGD